MIDGEPYFVGKDVAKALGYKNTKDAIKKHVDPEDKRGSRIATSSEVRKTIVINESGLYSFILPKEENDEDDNDRQIIDIYWNSSSVAIRDGTPRGGNEQWY